MKKFSILLLSIFSLLLVSCKQDTLSAKITIESITPARTSVYLVLNVDDPTEELTEGTIEAKAFYNGNLVSTAIAITDEDELTTVEVTGLSIGYEYKLEIYATSNKKGYKLTETTFKTSTLGATIDNPKIINTIDEFREMESDVSAYYRLGSDLDFSETPFVPMFQSMNFQGFLDGNGKTLKNITINQRRSYTSIFGRNNGTIKDLNVENITISLVGPNTSSQYVGLMVARNTGTLNNINILNGQVTLNFNYVGNVYVGGLVAYNDVNGKILNSSVKATFDLTSAGRTEFSAGGISGRVVASTITNSSAELTVNLDNADSAYIGGAIGYITNSATLTPNITKTQATLTLSSETNVVQTSKLDGKVEVIQVSIGGFVGRAVGTTFNEVYANLDMTLVEASNTSNEQSNYDTYAVGGFSGSISSSTSLTNVLVSSDILVGNSADEMIHGFERLYVGSITGEAYNSRYDKVLSIDSSIVVDSNNLLISLSPLNGNSEEIELGNFDAVTITLNTVEYLNQKVIQRNIDDLETLDLVSGSRTDYFTSEFILQILNNL
ncbi:MAG: hypothetical protein PHD47_01565 [Acholeplasmataceae bacterium]|nr:hypothetical protein [Acholeplasmataceae bacterium]